MSRTTATTIVLSMPGVFALFVAIPTTSGRLRVWPVPRFDGHPCVGQSAHFTNHQHYGCRSLSGVTRSKRFASP